ncbi:type II toxin-antitoxin system HipA family toxin [Shewanella sedimentimangrovi]|uniref:Type II toxin-antitoxin system HipA family toxin n=1 Tax=Shewanella sedimentimangrovi TaxID=2814293 RepID=A0ABX7R2E3_9GAMM|nr:type II toxin-antitoxin system HipA family toxin [Shewanella sedimentimangrovi]QSX37360.1 type II toxin-antitoxin system HipA family toxin [Shewanella sedimentimangrovi]
MKPNRIGYIYSNRRFAGELVEYNNPAGYEYRFTYGVAYIAAGLPQIGYNLPISHEAYRRNHLPPFFANLMSEGWVKRHQAKIARLDQDDKFGLLLGHGAELIGPVSVLTEYLGDELAPAIELPGVPKKSLKGYRIDFPRSEFNDVAIESLGGVSISGVQPKMFLTHATGKSKTLTNAVGTGPYIVKPSPNDFPELAENEFMIMQLCKAVGFNVAEHHLVPFSCGQLAYVTSRFDLDRETGRRTEFIEDLASALDVAPGNKSSDALSYEKAITTAYHLGGGHVQLLRDGFLQVLMAYLVGNNDLHLKNISLSRARDSNRASGYTPIYDMVSVAPYRHYDNAGELSIWLLESEVERGFSTSSYEHYGYYTGHDFLTFANAIGLGEKAGKLLMEELSKKVAKNYAKIIAASPGSDGLKQIISKRISDRLDTLTRPALDN